MRKLFVIPFLFFSLTTMAACSEQDEPKPETEQPTTPDSPDNGKTLVVYFSAQGHTQAVAERIVELTGADVCRIEAAEPYAVNPYDDSDRIQNEAYNDLRPGVANLPDAETIAQYDTIFIGSPCWWHQPAMVVCTFLEAYDLKDKVIVPFITYGATTYLNESMQKIYKLTPDSKHIPETLPEDLRYRHAGQCQRDGSMAETNRDYRIGISIVYQQKNDNHEKKIFYRRNTGSSSVRYCPLRLCRQ